MLVSPDMAIGLGQPAWAPDGSALLILESTSSSVFDPFTGQRLCIAGRLPRWSPAEPRLAYFRSVDVGLPIQGGGSASACILDITNGQATERLVGAAAWSPDHARQAAC